MKLKMAGNTNVGCVRKNNEDNFCVSADLQAGQFANASCPWGAEQVVNLGDKGVLLVVADGMGGTNAGEVASERAVTKAAQFFAPERITPEVTSSTGSILAFMEQAIVACDKEVKGWGDTHPESKGMGTTMVMGWILDGKLYVAWCGDSRAYVYRPGENKIYQVSKDHSYVQLLVDKAMLTREETFDHPQGNIITRSLSHGQPAARPESLPEPYTLCDGDIVLLCSDGLCGMLHDEEMADVISNSSDDAEQIVANLIDAARQAGGSDNITAVLCKVENGGKGTDDTSKAYFAVTEAALDGPGMDAEPKPTPLFRDESVAPQNPVVTPPPFTPADVPAPAPKRSDKKTLISVIVTLAVLIVCAGGWFSFNKMHKADKGGKNIAMVDEEKVDDTDKNKKTKDDNETDTDPVTEMEVDLVNNSAIKGQAAAVAAVASASSEVSKERQETLNDTLTSLINEIQFPIEINNGSEFNYIQKCEFLLKTDEGKKSLLKITFTSTLSDANQIDTGKCDAIVDSLTNSNSNSNFSKLISKYKENTNRVEIKYAIAEKIKQVENPGQQQD